MLLSIVAGRDSLQADGLGGVDMLLGKVVTVWTSTDPDVDVECSFGVITPGSDRIKYGANCGNLVAAVALYSHDQRLCSSNDATVRILNPDSGKRVDARVLDELELRKHGKRLRAMGVPTTGTAVELAFVDPVGTIDKGLLPTGRARNRIQLGNRCVDVSIIDSGALYLFACAADLGIEHATAPLTSEQQVELLRKVEELRGHAAVLCGLVDDPREARRLSPVAPKVALVSPPRDYRVNGSDFVIEADQVDLLARIISSQNLHSSYAVTGSVAISSAAVVPGSVVNRLVGEQADRSPFSLRVGHVKGVIEPRLDWHVSGDGVVVDRGYMIRTARKLMAGVSYAPH